MGKKKQFNQEQKLKILETAKEIGIKEASKHTGIHYTTVYDWRRQLEARGKEGFLAYLSITFARQGHQEDNRGTGKGGA